ncbi:hypothetical protein BJ956_002566 [Arthrobacter psychrochitiniphilus]|nr:hypothetical protein [Arthrobacter psychrochitiniphilus]
MGFAGAGRAEQDNVFCFFQEYSGAQMSDQGPIGSGLVVEVEFLQGLVAREFRALQN